MQSGTVTGIGTRLCHRYRYQALSLVPKPASGSVTGTGTRLSSVPELGPDRISGPVPVSVEFGPVPVYLAGTRPVPLFFMLD